MLNDDELLELLEHLDLEELELEGLELLNLEELELEELVKLQIRLERVRVGILKEYVRRDTGDELEDDD